MLHECIISLIYACTSLNEYFLNVLEIYLNIQIISIFLCYVALLSDGWIIETIGTITRYWAFQVMYLSLNLLNFKILTWPNTITILLEALYIIILIMGRLKD